MLTTFIVGIGLGILGWAQAESVRVGEIRPLSKAIHVANIWMCVGIGGALLIGVALTLLATGWRDKK